MSASPGAVVWLALGVALGAVLVATALAGRRRLPTVVDVMHWWLECWLGRLLVFAIWVEVGVHVFGQRP